MRHAVETVFADSRIQRAFQLIAERELEIEADQIRITLIPAPPFGETERARIIAEEFRKLHFHVVMDEIGNVIAPYEKFGPNPVVLGAHLDTVFPIATRLELRRRGRIIHLPGISDNGSGIAALIWALRAAREVGMRFRRPVIALGDLGEEGEGNLRGVRHLFRSPPWENRECDFIAIDGGGLQRITHQALGSRRFRIRMTGPGGHSWADFGRPNPVHTLASAIHRFTNGRGARRPGTSFNVGVFRGGISVNAIPTESIAEVDVRSITPWHLDELELQLRSSVNEVVSGTAIACRIDPMGERPAGRTPVESPLVQAAQEITRHFGIEPQLDIGSTDANIPMSLGVPAIAIGAGGTSGNVHTPEEWFDPTHRSIGVQRLLALVAVLAELV